jgi:glucans biosynthesis protein
MQLPPIRLLFKPAFILLVVTVQSQAGRAQDEPFTFVQVERQAQELVGRPYKEAPSIEGPMRQLDYDKYRAIRARPNTALWHDSKGLFRAEFFPAGFIYEKPVSVWTVEGGRAQPLTAPPDWFDFSDTGLKEPPQKIDIAGIRLLHPLNRPGKFDEVLSFLGASYFRAVGRGQVYGASARALAIDTAAGRPEEFPAFRSFWLVKPADDATDMQVWALLDSPGATGAFAFTLRPGTRTEIDVHAVLFLRRDIGVLGIAPLTSMFYAGKASPPRDDYRPEIHDSDGLSLSLGNGERLWRPLENPGALAVASFQDSNPKGFGLMQRERHFARYQDTGAHLERRPSLWVRPKDDWGDGDVRLVEIPTQSDANDNVVAFWVSRWPGRKGERKEYNYTLSALEDDKQLLPGGRVVATRASAVPNAPRLRRLLVEFAGDELASLDGQQPVAATISIANGKLSRSYVEQVPGGNWRVFIDFEPEAKKAVDLRALLEMRGRKLTETWTTTWRP